MLFLGKKRAALTFSIDDCWKQTIDTFQQIVSERGLHATFNVITGLVGREINSVEFADWVTLRHLVRLGCELASHSHTHRPGEQTLINLTRRIACGINSENPLSFIRRALLTLKPNQHMAGIVHLDLEEDVRLSKEKIENFTGMPCVSYVYPTGAYNQWLKKLVEASGYLSARSSDIGYNHPADLDTYALRVKVWDQTTTAEVANRWVDKAILHNLWLIEVLHAFDFRGYLYGASLKNYRLHLKYIWDNLNHVWIATQGQVAKYLICMRKKTQSNV